MIESTSDDVSGRGALLHLPAADADDVEQVALALGALVEKLPKVDVMLPVATSPHLPCDAGFDSLTIYALEPLLSKTQTVVRTLRELSIAEQFAPLIFSLLMPEAIAVAALQVAFGCAVASLRAEELADIREDLRRYGGGYDSASAYEEEELDQPGTTMRLFRGEYAVPPDRERIARGIAVLRRAASLTHESLRSNILCVIGWLHWARDERVLANVYVEEVLRLDAEHDVARWLRTRICARGMPSWEKVLE